MLWNQFGLLKEINEEKAIKTSLENLTTNFKFNSYLCINLFMAISSSGILGHFNCTSFYVDSLFQLWEPISGGVNVKSSRFTFLDLTLKGLLGDQASLFAENSAATFPTPSSPDSKGICCLVQILFGIILVRKWWWYLMYIYHWKIVTALSNHFEFGTWSSKVAETKT